MRRGFWFTAGAAAGAYGVIRVRRAAEALTPDGMRDRLAGLSVAARLFGEEVRAGMDEKESQLRERMGLMLDGHEPPGALPGGDAGAGAGTDVETLARARSSTRENPRPANDEKEELT